MLYTLPIEILPEVHYNIITVQEKQKTPELGANRRHGCSSVGGDTVEIVLALYIIFLTVLVLKKK